ncbi:trifunctional transcriptional regulator/proline dehydrogenase/L-glutamate gamma-semialdehyde dehydrogenase [Comamonas sp. NoAH]|uniref:trifunctional transcriptional regulator/proline dehydrogenase/L-glutamate gamma-semialdehyde dehydrogenase n=1 Tax=Comamonas halotolerans TaxID=3041496 RepID=UPI0024E1790D|nr:trifunctional transcriptional regulator/proline dehydrogenase/L-glutamate gamma-semialdehyde dehydrogenase [Comamonas sp. NoAH]
MATTTIGIKVDELMRDRLKAAAQQLGCTPHWLHKQALHSYLEAIEQGKPLPELQYLGTTNAMESVEPETISEAAAPYAPFYALAQDVQPQSVLRAAITAAYRRPETECLPLLIAPASSTQPEGVQTLATRLVHALRAKRHKKTSGVEALVQEYSLSSQEGVALMCLAEALLRIPDRATRDALIRDKVSKGDWKSHTDSPSVFVNAATWGLMITGKLVGVHSEQKLSSALTRLIARGGEPLIRQGVNTAMRMMGEQFVTGQTIGAALANSRKLEEKGFRYSYDMLGEAATTEEDALRYLQSYEQAIHAIGQASQGRGIYEGPGISIKLSALHPRYSRAQRERVMNELYPRLLKLAELARHYDIGLNIDAEEADRLEISLDLLEQLCFAPSLAGWNGIGFVVQAYQRRAFFVLDWIIDLARRSQHRLMVRLVKGAYWDSEIKRAQVDGLEDFPVFTRKIHTDVSYLACARKLLGAPEAIFPQFATHNAHTLASIYHMAGNNYYRGQYEFQCLHGMGEGLYEEVVGDTAHGKLARPCRIYAPVGTHETLLAYLVRRLLENGANSSFVHQIGDENLDIAQLVADPVKTAQALTPLGRPHDRIPRPADLYAAQARSNSLGVDLSNEQRLASLSAALLSSVAPLNAEPEQALHLPAQPVVNPAHNADVLGEVRMAGPDEVAQAMAQAQHTAPIWQATPVSARAQALQRAADLMQAQLQPLMGLLCREAGKTLPNAISEVREAIDFLRYYAQQAEQHLDNDSHRPLGVVVCISPWNFPLAIFTGQIAAALAAGNVVIAKPAEQTNLIAAQAVAMLHHAGIPTHALQMLPGDGETVGEALVAHSATDAVVFTGSHPVAQHIHRTLSQRLGSHGKPVPLIAETGGINAMVVDSSALSEQVVGDVLMSAYDSAGQRCSALRLLCLQEDSADHVLHMLRGAMQELRVGNPDQLATDVGPVIDAQAKADIEGYIDSMRSLGHRVTRLELPAECRHGYFVAPTLIEVNQVQDLSREVFGPVLHVLRYARKDMDALLEQINQLGFGLTFGVHTRLDETVAHVSQRIHAGNIYVNRNIVGAVVGVQPFGGEGLSGTGPKAGGPLYLFRLLAQAPVLQSIPIITARGPHTLTVAAGEQVLLDGPTGETNQYGLQPRGLIWCMPQSEEGLQAQWQACQHTGNTMVLQDSPHLRELVAQWQQQMPDSKHARLQWATEAALIQLPLQAALAESDTDALLHLQQQLSARSGPLLLVQGLTTEEICSGERYRPERLLREVSISTNTTAAGGNASLMMVG